MSPATDRRKVLTQACLDTYADKHNPCCAGCDWWRWHNSVVGDCTRTAPLSGAERIAMLGVSRTSFPVPAGHIMTMRDHVCGEFKNNPPAPRRLNHD